MIPLVDIALASRLALTNPGVELRWAPPFDNEQAPNVRPRATDASSAGKVGRPAATLFRPSVTVGEFVNVPQQDVGFRGALSEDKRTISMHKRIAVDAQYTYQVWAYKQSEIDEICRRTLYSLVYEPVRVVFAGVESRYRIDSTDPVYATHSLDKDDTIRAYSLTFDFTVLDAFWALEEEVNTVIYPIMRLYDQITNGSPILLDELKLIPEGF